MPWIWSMISSTGVPLPKVQGDEATCQLGHAVLEAAALSKRPEDLERLAVLVH